MDHIVPTFYKTYGKYVNESRAFPLDVDGLKPVERRVLLSAFQVAKDKLVKSARVDGHTIANFHPHGTSYSTLVNLVQMKFLEGRKVRDVAMRLAMSEADLYRKQRVALEEVTKAIADMERDATFLAQESET